MNNVCKFIESFTLNDNGIRMEDVIDIFTKRCNYWFAVILFRRFIENNAIIMYSEQEHCFGTMIHGNVYDINGDVTSRHKWVPWIELSNETRKQVFENYIIL